MTESDYDAQMEQARTAAKELKSQLEEEILGERIPAHKCICHMIHIGESEAVEIIPPNGNDEGQLPNPGCWRVRMKQIENHDEHPYVLDLGPFFKGNYSEVTEMFDAAFDGINREKLEMEFYHRNPEVFD